MNQKQDTIALTEKLLASLRSAPDPVNNDKGASYLVIHEAIKHFIDDLDCAKEDSAFILGDGDLAQLYATYLARRGKDANIGNLIFGVAFLGVKANPDDEDEVTPLSIARLAFEAEGVTE